MNEQIAAMATVMDESLSTGQLREVLALTTEMLEAGEPTVAVLRQVARKLVVGFDELSLADQAPLYVMILRGLLAADRVTRLGPIGVLPIRLKEDAR